MTKVVKISLIPNVKDKDGKEVARDKVNKILWQLQDDVRTIKNKSVQLNWEWNNFKLGYKNSFSEYPSEKDYLMYKTVDGYIYDKLKGIGHGNSSNKTTTIRDVVSHYKKSQKEILIGDVSVPSYKKGQPIDVHNKAITLNYEDKIFKFQLSLLDKDGMKEHNINRFDFNAIVDSAYIRPILERCYDGIYKISASKLIYVKKSGKKKYGWFLFLSYTFENKEKPKELDRNKTLGIDLGIAKVCVCSVYGYDGRFQIDGGEIYTQNQLITKRRKQLSKQAAFCGQGRIGHGYKTRMKPVLAIEDKIARFRDTTNHKYSKAIVDYAVKNCCGKIQMEDLSGIGDEAEQFIKNWSYFDLQNKITYKAQNLGIEVIKVNPCFTSQRCSKCGHIESGNRKTQSEFKCVKCGYEENADFNASQNISIEHIDKIIEEYCKDRKDLNYRKKKKNGGKSDIQENNQDENQNDNLPESTKP